MKKAGLVIYSILLWTFFLATSICYMPVAGLIWVTTRWFDRRLLILHLWSCFWGSCYIWCNPLWWVTIRGRRKIPWKRPCILVSNHQSMVDIVVLYKLFAPFKWISKKENYSIPFVGWLMRLNDYLEIDRGRKDSLVRLMEKASKLIAKGCSIMIFPEGTRYPGDTLGPFREGAFKMALDNRVDIVPIVLDGTAKALPKKGAILTGLSNIRVRVLDPIPYSSFEGKTTGELKTEVRDLMQGEFERLRSGWGSGTDI